MNFKRYLLATLILFIFIFLYEWFVHGYLLMNMYRATALIWRNFGEMEANMPRAMLFQVVFSLWTAFIFTQLFPESGIRQGLLFGLYFGVFAGILTASWYLWLPVSAKLGWSWFVSGIAEGLGSGFILGAVYRK